MSRSLLILFVGVLLLNLMALTLAWADGTQRNPCDFDGF